MSVEVLLGPVVVAAGAFELQHFVCGWDCDDDLALCGLDVSAEPWDDGGEPCIVCVDLHELPYCQSLTCPGRRRA